MEEGVEVIGDGEEGGEEEAGVTAATGPSAAAEIESAQTTSYLESASETDARTRT